MARSGGSCHSDDDDHGVRAFWADQELQWNRRGEFARHRPEGVGDRVYGAAISTSSLAVIVFMTEGAGPQASATTHVGQRILASTPLYRDSRAIHRHFNNPNWATHSSLSTRRNCSAGSTKDYSPYQVFDESPQIVTQASASWCLGNQPKSYNGMSYSGALSMVKTLESCQKCSYGAMEVSKPSKELEKKAYTLFRDIILTGKENMNSYTLIGKESFIGTSACLHDFSHQSKTLYLLKYCSTMEFLISDSYCSFLVAAFPIFERGLFNYVLFGDCVT